MDGYIYIIYNGQQLFRQNNARPCYYYMDYCFKIIHCRINFTVHCFIIMKKNYDKMYSSYISMLYKDNVTATYLHYKSKSILEVTEPQNYKKSLQVLLSSYLHGTSHNDQLQKIFFYQFPVHIQQDKFMCCKQDHATCKMPDGCKIQVQDYSLSKNKKCSSIQ